MITRVNLGTRRERKTEFCKGKQIESPNLVSFIPNRKVRYLLGSETPQDRIFGVTIGRERRRFTAADVASGRR